MASPCAPIGPAAVSGRWFDRTGGCRQQNRIPGKHIETMGALVQAMNMAERRGLESRIGY
jgi:hypothetical protein